MSLKLVKLELEGFKSFKQKATIDFPESGLVLVSGKYKNSQVSSGSGKSSILEAIAFALDICDTPSTELKNWDAKKMSVTLTITDGTNLYNIIKDPKLSLVINGVPYEGMTTGAKEKLQEILGTTPDILKAITYRQQRTPGQFINATDSELKQFLTQPLGLDEIESAAEQFTKDANLMQTQLDFLKRDIEGLVSMAGTPVTDEELSKANGELVIAEAAQRQSRDVLDAARMELDALTKAPKDKELVEKLNMIKVELAKAKDIKSRSEQASFRNSILRTDILNLKSEIDKMSTSVCPTCEREWQSGQQLLASKEDQLNQMIKAMEINLSYIKNAQNVIESIPTFESSILEISTALNNNKPQLESAENSYRMAENNYRLASSNCNLAQTNCTHLLTKRQDQAKHAAKIQVNREKLLADEAKLKTVQLAAKLLGRNGFLGTIFDEILVDIQHRCNDMVGMFPNASQFAISIASEKVTKTKGTLKKEIAVGITKDGKDISLRSLSGGQQCSLELCADLASAEAIRSRSGALFGWICLDEAMDGLGSEEKQAAINMIKERIKGLILIVDHATEIKEGFEKVIEVEYNGKESYVLHQ